MARTWILRNVVLVALIHLGLSPMAWSEPVAFNVKTYFVKEPGKRQLVEKDAVLVLDDSTRKLTVRSKERPLDTSFDDIEKVVFEVSARRRGGAWSQLGIVGAIVAAQTINDYWCHLAVQTPQGTEHYLLEIPKDTSSTVIDRAKALLGPKVLIPTFAEQPKAMRIEDLKARESKQDLKVDRKTFLTPELKPDKALVVVLSPIWSESILQTKLHANDEVVAINTVGTYSFAYLDPGEYVLAAQMRRQVSGFSTTLEAGKEYYFMLNLGVELSRHTKELVTFLLQGAAHAQFQLKQRS